jgi:hypothetical protein
MKRWVAIILLTLFCAVGLNAARRPHHAHRHKAHQAKRHPPHRHGT